MKRHYQRLLAPKDMKDSPKELSAFEKLVEVCRVARDLYYQQDSHEALNTNHIDSIRCFFDQVGQVSDKSWGKKPIQEDAPLFFKDEILVGSSISCISQEELFKGSKTKRNNIDSNRCSGFDQVGKAYDKTWGKKPIEEDFKDEILVGSASCISQEELFKGSKTKRSNIDSNRCSGFDQVGKAYDKSWGKKPIQEDAPLFFKDEILVGSTSGISREELFKGSKTKRGESSSARFFKLKIKRSGDDHDYLEGKKAEKWNDYNGDILNKKTDRFVQGEPFERVRKRPRKSFASCEDHQVSDYSEKKKKKKKPRSTCNARQKVARVTSPLPVEFKNEIQEMRGTDIKLVIQKSLFSADTDGGQNRFSIPMKQIRENFLREEEEHILDQRFEDNHVVPMTVPLIEPNLGKTQINFRKWAVNSSYVLSCPWNDIRDRNALEVDMEMQLWSFRVDGALNFALVKVNN